MAATVSTIGAVNKSLENLILQLSLNNGSVGSSVPSSGFFGKGLKKTSGHRVAMPKISNSRQMRVAAEAPEAAEPEIDEQKQTNQDRWKGLVEDISDDQQDITRGKGLVDSLFQAPMGTGTHHAVLSSYEYISQGLREYNIDNTLDGFYIAPAFMDKLVVHITKNFLKLPNIKIPLILGVWGGKGQGKSFQCELVFRKMGINPIMMSAGELESGNAGEPAKLIRQRYREAAEIIRKGNMCVLFINDLDAGAGRMGGTTQYTVNNQMVNATLMNIADNPTNVQLPGMYNKQENARVPIIVTGNDFSTLYAPLIRDGRMEKFYWAPTREDRIGVCKGIFRTDGVPDEHVVKLVDTFPGQSIDFFGALRARVYDDEVRKFIASIGVDAVNERLLNSRDGPPKFDQPKMTIEKLLQYGYMLVQEQENVKRVQLADKYLKEAALGDANEDAIKNGNFYGQGAQSGNLKVPEGCTDPQASNFDPTARSDDGTCTYQISLLDCLRAARVSLSLYSLVERSTDLFVLPGVTPLHLNWLFHDVSRVLLSLFSTISWLDLFGIPHLSLLLRSCPSTFLTGSLLFYHTFLLLVNNPQDVSLSYSRSLISDPHSLVGLASMQGYASGSYVGTEAVARAGSTSCSSMSPMLSRSSVNWGE
nr:ribulose bisphosphate carboxylase/oxygenase activase, chloroplastic-like [Ipomoea batatas]